MEAVRDASKALLDSNPILPPSAVVDGMNNEDGEGRGSIIDGGSTTVLVHQALAEKAERHHSFVGFLHSTMLWSAIR